MTQDILVYDIETVGKRGGKWQPSKKQTFASAALYSYKEDRYHFFLHEKNKEKLINRLTGNICISFNGVNFDSLNLLPNRIVRIKNRDLLTVRQNNYSWDEYDIFLVALRSFYKAKSTYDVIKKLSKGGMRLDDLCKNTLGSKYKKIDVKNAGDLYLKMQFDKLFSYNLQDIRILKKLFEHTCKKNWIRTGKKEIFRIPRPIFSENLFYLDWNRK